MMWNWFGAGIGGWWMWLMPIGMLLLLGFGIWAIIAFTRGTMHVGCGHAEHTTRSGDSALDTLKQRYVRGEINRQQYEEMKKDIL